MNLNHCDKHSTSVWLFDITVGLLVRPIVHSCFAFFFFLSLPGNTKYRKQKQTWCRSVVRYVCFSYWFFEGGLNNSILWKQLFDNITSYIAFFPLVGYTKSRHIYSLQLRTYYRLWRLHCWEWIQYRLVVSGFVPRLLLYCMEGTYMRSRA